MRFAVAFTLLYAPFVAAQTPTFGPVVKVQGGFKFVEGPTADAKGDVYFSDIPNDRIHKLEVATGKISLFREKTNKANGSMVNARGEIVSCEGESGCVVAFSADGKDRRVLASEFGGKRFNAPNDLVIDRVGGIYFTDPEYAAPKPWPQVVRTFYYLAADGKVSRMVDKDLPNPNGIILSPDEKTLYIIPSSSSEMLAYAVEAPGKLGPARPFGTLKQAEGKKNGGGDGLAIDTAGNLYVTTGIGVQVFSPKGEHLTTLAVPEGPANCDFGGPDMKTLYITARTSLYSVATSATGHRFAAGK